MTSGDLKSSIKYWSTGAVEDLETARDILSKTNRYYSGLFFLHLSVEKRLKSIFVKKNKAQPPFTHNLVFIAEKCGIEMTAVMRKNLTSINEFNLSTRYPDEKKGITKKFTKDFAKKWLKQVESMHKFLDDF